MYDDTDVLVGITDVKVRKVDGGGLVENAGVGGTEKTKNGQSDFTYIAPSSAGMAEVLNHRRRREPPRQHHHRRAGSAGARHGRR